MARSRLIAATAAAVLLAALIVVLAGGVVPTPEPREAVDELGSRLGAATYALVAGMTFLETGALVGLVAPGDFTLLVGGAIAAQGEIALLPLLALVWVAAVLGDSVSFWLGRRYGRALLLRHGPRFRVTPERLRRVECYFARWGGPTIIVGRFIGLVRALAPFVAGASRMPYRRFLPFSIAGTGPWVATYVLLGFAFYRSLDRVAEIAGLATVGLAAAVALGAGLTLLRRRARAGTPSPGAAGGSPGIGCLPPRARSQSAAAGAS